LLQLPPYIRLEPLLSLLLASPLRGSTLGLSLGWTVLFSRRVHLLLPRVIPLQEFWVRALLPAAASDIFHLPLLPAKAQHHPGEGSLSLPDFLLCSLIHTERIQMLPLSDGRSEDTVGETWLTDDQRAIHPPKVKQTEA